MPGAVSAPIITLLTDFGLTEGTPAILKGVLLSLAPEARLIDLSHDIQPQDVRQAAIVLDRAAPFFPEGSIHLVVVDPGVGTARRPMAARLGRHLFVGPDNGVVTRLLQRAEREQLPTEFIHLDRPEWWRPEVSDVFHGRDIFAPVAGHLARGIRLADLGSRMRDPVRLEFSAVSHVAGGLRGAVELVDHFGNLRTNIRREDCGGATPRRVRLAAVEIEGLVRTFGEAPAGSVIAFWGSGDELCVAEVNGSAAARLGAGVGTEIELAFG
jgi:S-adenosylmethionine hydrolase